MQSRVYQPTFLKTVLYKSPGGGIAGKEWGEVEKTSILSDIPCLGLYRICGDSQSAVTHPLSSSMPSFLPILLLPFKPTQDPFLTRGMCVSAS